MYLVEKQDYSLRPIVENDLKTVLQWRNSDRIRDVLYNDHIISLEEHFVWYQKIKSDENCSCLIFSIKQLAYGVVNLTNLDTMNKKSLLGFYLGREDALKGTGSIMLFLALDYIFINKAIRQLCTEVLAFNLVSINLHRKFGFCEEGCLKQPIFKNNAYHDVFQFSISDQQWLEKREMLTKTLFRASR